MSTAAKSRYRIGVRIPVFTNAGIMVVYLKPVDASRIKEALDLIKMLLTANGQETAATRLVFEAS